MRMVTNGDHMIEFNVSIFFHVIGSVLMDINPIFCHHTYRNWIESMGFDAGTLDFGMVSGKFCQIPMCHLTSARISGAENQYF